MVEACVTALNAIMATPEVTSGDLIWPVAAPVDVEGLFITYKVDELVTATKSGINQDRLTIGVFEKDYLKVAELADAIKAQILKNDQGTNFYHEGTTSDYSEDLERVFVSISFTFKHS